MRKTGANVREVQPPVDYGAMVKVTLPRELTDTGEAKTILKPFVVCPIVEDASIVPMNGSEVPEFNVGLGSPLNAME
jgi:hypothetical protein